VALTVFIVALILSGIDLINWGAEAAHRRAVVGKYNKAIAQNHFWDMLSGRVGTDGSHLGNLAGDLQPFLKTERPAVGINSALFPKDLTEVYVPPDSHRYDGINKQMKLVVFANQEPNSGTNSYQTSGRFSGSFLEKIALVRAGKTDILIQRPTKPVDIRYHGSPFNLPFSQTVPVAAGVALLAGFGFAIGNDRYEYAATVASNKRKLAEWAEKRRLEREALEKNPCMVELIAARKNLERLLSLPQIPEVKTATKNCKALVSELERFPDVITEKAAKLIVRQIDADNQLLQDRPRALLEAQDEVNNL
jgi:hypothetical protein